MTQALTSVSILGATGSVGRQALALIAKCPEQFNVQTLVAGKNWQQLAALAIEHRPRYAVIADPAYYQPLKAALQPHGITTAAGNDAVLDAAQQPVDVCVAGIVGVAGLAPTMGALRAARRLAFASKECLVCAGSVFMQQASAHGCKIIPTDSEHSALYQLLRHEDQRQLARVVLTASGGPFLRHTPEQLVAVTPDQATAHPVWPMGRKISIDSATLMNKGLELIEAHFLFNLAPKQIEVLIHPQSIVHALVEWQDGAVMAHMGMPDMQLPLGYALFWPKRGNLPHLRMDYTKLSQLQFETPDHAQFPALALAQYAAQAGGEAALALNAANEIAVARFLAGELPFLDIVNLCTALMERWQNRASFATTPTTVDLILNLDREFRAVAAEWRPATHGGFTPIRVA